MCWGKAMRREILRRNLNEKKRCTKIKKFLSLYLPFFASQLIHKNSFVEWIFLLTSIISPSSKLNCFWCWKRKAYNSDFTFYILNIKVFNLYFKIRDDVEWNDDLTKEAEEKIKSNSEFIVPIDKQGNFN